MVLKAQSSQDTRVLSTKRETPPRRFGRRAKSLGGPTTWVALRLRPRARKLHPSQATALSLAEPGKRARNAGSGGLDVGRVGHDPGVQLQAGIASAVERLRQPRGVAE